MQWPARKQRSDKIRADPTHPNFFKITKVTDSFGRSATFEYNEAGQLAKITDVIGLSSPGQTNPIAGGTSNKPVKVARKLDDGTEQAYFYDYNAAGNVLRSVDPLGRETSYIYAANGIDVTAVRQKRGTEFETLQSFTYNSQHRPLTVTDASGQVTSYTYTAVGQVETITNAKNEVTTFVYGTDAAQPDYGRVKAVTGPVAGATVRYTYDAFGRVRSTTDSEGYTLTFDYDAFDRPLKTTYPDGSYTQLLYNRLDVEWMRDRLGRWTHDLRDVNRRLVMRTDPLQRKTRYDWCTCGSLNALIDPAGQVTKWERDVQGRVTAKVYPDGTRETLSYEATTSRLKKRTDGRGQVTNYTYYKDNAVAALTYTDTAGVPLVPATPGVTYAYDPVYPRLTSMTDGVGTTRYTYNPIPPAPITTPVTGAGRLATIDGPLTNDTIAYTYDALGRQLSASINGAANTIAMTYDALGRVATQTNALGTFTYSYVSVTGRLDHLDYPSGQRANFAYYPNMAATGTGNGDQRLRQIQHLKPGGSVLSTFSYTYDPVGQIQSWGQQTDAGAPLTSTYRYDAAGQLIGAVIPSSGSGSRGYVYGYDLAGNRTEEQIDAGVTTSSYNNLNQLTGQSAGGRMSFSGTVNEPSTVSLAGTPASVDASNRWRGQASVSPGANAIPLVATDVNGNVTNKTINVTVASGGARTLSYDLAGNLIDDGAGKAYGWDALNRLVKITQGANVTEFGYDGNGRRVQEKLNGTLIKQWIWCDGPQPCEERDAAGNVTKRFYSGLGEQIAGTNYYYSTDHLGSIREMTDSTGAVRARYSYDPYGRISKISGDLEADFGFTGFYRHQASGLNLTIYRAYDPELGRWLSRDPIEENGGLNLYGYVSNSPIGLVDLLGLDPYLLNRQLNPHGLPDRSPVSRSNPVSHTFTYTTNPNGSLGHTYSWGNKYDSNKNGLWVKDAPEDRSAAQKDIDIRTAYENAPWWKQPFIKSPYGERVDDSSLDPYLDPAFNNKSNEPGHPWCLNNNCKDDADELIDEARRLRGKKPCH